MGVMGRIRSPTEWSLNPSNSFVFVGLGDFKIGMLILMTNAYKDNMI